MSQNEELRILTEEDAEKVIGGAEIWDRYPPPKSWEYGAEIEGKRILIPGPCPFCGAEAGGQYSMYARVDVNDYPPEVFYRDVKCYACGKNFGEIDAKGNVTIS